jgi:hypothetical protein
MKVTYHRTTDGQQVEASAALDERGIIRDGFTMRSNVMLMDGRTVDPQDGGKDYSAVDAYRRRISDEWRSPDQSHLGDGQPTKPDTAALAKIADPYERYDRALEGAWK